MKQKWLSFGTDYSVMDEAGNEAFFIDGRAVALGNQLSVESPRGSEVAFISQKLFSWGPTYEITRGGSLAAVVKKKLFTFFRCQFEVDVPGPDDLLAEGDFLDFEYEFTRSGRSVARVSKRFFSWTDTYGIEMLPGEDDALIVASVVVIDLCCHQDRS
jgi:uncharacterized protein YxjI